MGNHSRPRIRISVRNLVEFVMRSGDLDNRRTVEAKKEAMQAGSRLHRKIQKRMGASYHSEIVLRYRMQGDMLDILVEGRADGIITKPVGVTIDEIKCIYMDVSKLEEPEPVHLAQTLCYGWFHSIQKELDSVDIQITYCDIETEEIRRFKEVESFEELKSWFEELIHGYVKWARYLYHHGIHHQECLKELPFPYPYREGQKELAGNVYRSIARKRNLFIQAPTEVGKTLSIIYPGLKAMGEGHGKKLFYLTTKTITRSVAEEAFSILRREGHLYFNTIIITAKERPYVMEKPDCNPQACPRAEGHYDRVDDAVYEIIQEVNDITRDKVLEYAQRYQICPFEFCLDISNWVDGITHDYNYVFDPNVRLGRYFDQRESDQGCLFLMDEARNLVPKAREMYSASLIEEDVLLTKRVLKTQTGSGRAVVQSDRCSQRLLELRHSYGVDEDGRRMVLGSTYELLPDVNALALNLMTMLEEPETFMNKNVESMDRDLMLEFYFTIRDFLYVYNRLDEHYRTYDQILTGGSLMVRLLCIGPATSLKECLDKSASTLFLSATPFPIQYYRELLSGNQEEYAVYAKSSFPQENHMVLTASDVNSRYSRRGPSGYEKIVDYICQVVEGKERNYMVFCPSYQYLHAIEDILAARETSGALFFIWDAQTNHMTEEDRGAFLQSFGEKRDCSMATLCIMGGIFLEGIDLGKGRLIDAVVIGTGLPQVNTEQEILKEYFDEQGEYGFDYAYQYPGVNKVMQTAGRVIRTIRDKGIIALLDGRFLHPEYAALFPRKWGTYTVISRYNVDQAVRVLRDGTK